MNLPLGASACPPSLRPQQTAVPSVRIPHEWMLPADIAVSLVTLAVLVVAAGVVVVVVVVVVVEGSCGGTGGRPLPVRLCHSPITYTPI